MRNSYLFLYDYLNIWLYYIDLYQSISIIYPPSLTYSSIVWLRNVLLLLKSSLVNTPFTFTNTFTASLSRSAPSISRPSKLCLEIHGYFRCPCRPQTQQEHLVQGCQNVPAVSVSAWAVVVMKMKMPRLNFIPLSVSSLLLPSTVCKTKPLTNKWKIRSDGNMRIGCVWVYETGIEIILLIISHPFYYSLIYTPTVKASFTLNKVYK